MNAPDLMWHTPLMSAAFDDNTELLTAMLNSGADVNINDREGNTALIYAAEKNLSGNVKILLDYGADKSIKNIDGKSAVDAAHSEDVKRLLA